MNEKTYSPIDCILPWFLLSWWSRKIYIKIKSLKSRFPHSKTKYLAFSVQTDDFHLLPFSKERVRVFFVVHRFLRWELLSKAENNSPFKQISSKFRSKLNEITSLLGYSACKEEYHGGHDLFIMIRHVRAIANGIGINKFKSTRIIWTLFFNKR